MLILSRKSDESLTFFMPDGQKMLLKVKEVTGQSMKIAIDAPKNVRIVRTELIDQTDSNPLSHRPPSPQPLPAS